MEANPQRIIQRLLTKYRKDLDLLTLELAEELEEYTLASLISLYKANLVTPRHVREKAKSTVDELVAKVYQGYEEQLQKSNKIDRDDMVSLAAQLLADNADIRARYQYLYDFVLVDEFQDATAAADLLARVLALPQDNLYIAGDEDESIFESKGALPKILSEVSVRLPNGRCYVLERNWRNHPGIVESAIRLVGGLHRRRIAKEMVPGWEMPDSEAVIGPHLAESESLEAEWVAGEIQTLLESGRNPQDIAILYRYNRYASMVEEALFRKGIKCLTTNPDSTMVPDEVADVMAFLRLVMDPDGPKARESFERVCQLRSKEVDPKLFGTIASFAEANNLSFIKAVEIYSEAVADQSCQDVGQLVLIIRTMNHENLPPAETIALLKRTQRLNEYYKSVKVPPGVNYEPMRKLGQLEEEARKYKTVSEFVKSQSSAKSGADAGESEPLVYILSLHEAKGKEYPVVFLTGMAEGLFPSETANDPEEERRLCYLGISRAKELLYLSYPSQFNDVPLAPSRYLVDMGLVAPPGPVISPEEQHQAMLIAQQKAAQLKAQHEDMLKAQQLAQTKISPADSLKAQQDAQVKAQLGAQYAAHQQAQMASQQQAQIAAQQRAQILTNQQAQIVAQQQAQIAAQQQAQIAAQQQAQLAAQQQAQLAAQQQQAHLAAQQQAQLAAQQAIQQQAQMAAQQQMIQEAMLAAQQEEQARLEQEEQLRAQQEAALQAQQEAALRAQQEAALQAHQEAALKAQQEEQLKAQQEAQLRAQEEAQQRAAQAAAIRAQHEEQMRAQEEARLRAQEEAGMRAQQVAMLREQQEQLRIAQEAAQARAQEEAQMRAVEEERIKAEQLAREQAVKDAKEEVFIQEQQRLVVAQREEAQRRAAESAALIAQQEAQMIALKEQEMMLRAQEQAQLEAQARAQREAEEFAALQAEVDERMAREQAEAYAEEQSKLALERAQQAQQMLFQSKPEDQVPAPEPPPPEPEVPKTKGKGKKKAAAAEPPKEDFAPDVPIGVPPPAVPTAPLSADPGLPPASAESFSAAPPASSIDPTAITAAAPVQQGQFAPFADPDMEEPHWPQTQPQPQPQAVAEPDAPDPRDVFWSNVNKSMLHGVKEIPAAAPQAPAPFSAPGQGEAQVPSQVPLQGAAQGSFQGSSPGPFQDPGTMQAPLGNVSPAEFYPDGVTVPGPMSTQVARQYPGGVPPEPLAPMQARRASQSAPQPLHQPAPVVPSGLPGLICPGCSSLLEAGSRFCGECGFRLEVRITACHLCGAPLEPNARFCGECGSQMHDKGAKAQASMVQPGAISTEQQQYETYLSGQKPSQQGWVTKLKKLLD